jgi:hypothetical protein
MRRSFNPQTCEFNASRNTFMSRRARYVTRSSYAERRQSFSKPSLRPVPRQSDIPVVTKQCVRSGRSACVNILNVIENLTTMLATNPPPWQRGIRKFIPLIVTKDEIGPSWGVDCYLNERCKDPLFRKAYKNYTITPLVCMSASTLERSVCPMKKIVFSKILKNRITADPKLKFPFEWASRYVPRARRDACMPIWKR